MYKQYLDGIGASDEVRTWCSTVLAARSKKKELDQAEVEHVLDYLCSDAAPVRLRRMSYKQAVTATEKWSKANQKRGKDLVDEPCDLEAIHDFGDGSRIVKLLTKKACQREAFFMAHCVGGYDPRQSTIYSYRDKKNIPHATFEVTKSGEEIQQIKGKGNGPIHPKYIDPILTFLRAIGKSPRPSEMKNLGYYHIQDSIADLLEQFVDSRGKGPQFVHLEGERYLVGAV